MAKIYTSINDLPKDIQNWFCKYWKNAETQISKPIPALGNRSVLDMMNTGEEGEIELRKYIEKVRGYFDFL